jgi:hypothetical protein
MSDEDLEKGKPWFPGIVSQIVKSPYCILFLTDQNVGSPWLYFEAGGVHFAMKDPSICSYLVNISPSAISGTPLAQFQATKYTKEDTWRLVRDINKSLPKPHDEGVLRSSFNQNWNSLKRKVDRLLIDYEKEKAGRHDETGEESEDGPGRSQGVLTTPAPASRDAAAQKVLEVRVIRVSLKTSLTEHRLPPAPDPYEVYEWDGFLELYLIPKTGSIVAIPEHCCRASFEIAGQIPNTPIDPQDTKLLAYNADHSTWEIKQYAIREPDYYALSIKARTKGQFGRLDGAAKLTVEVRPIDPDQPVRVKIDMGVPAKVSGSDRTWEFVPQHITQ